MKSEPPAPAGFEWDEDKRALNLMKNGLDFRRAVLIFRGDAVEFPDHRQDYGESRMRVFGEIEGRLYTVVYTWRGLSRRLISARKANGREQRAYYARDP